MTKQKVRMCMEHASAVVLAVCLGGTVVGAENVRVVDCKGREFASPTCMTEERMFKVADKELTNGGVKVLSLDSRIQKCAKAALEKYADAKNVEFATAVILDAKSGAIRGAAEVRCGYGRVSMFRYADALSWDYEPGGLMYPIIAALAAESGREWDSLGSALASGSGDVFEEFREKTFSTIGVIGIARWNTQSQKGGVCGLIHCRSHGVMRLWRISARSLVRMVLSEWLEQMARC